MEVTGLEGFPNLLLMVFPEVETSLVCLGANWAWVTGLEAGGCTPMSAGSLCRKIALHRGTMGLLCTSCMSVMVRHRLVELSGLSGYHHHSKVLFQIRPNPEGLNGTPHSHHFPVAGAL